MPDNLRDRVAAALQGAADDGYSAEDWLFLADAVIEALELAREGPNQAWIDAGLPIRYRWVTEWQAE